MPTAILIDGGFFLRRYRYTCADWERHTPKQVAKNLFDWATKHLSDGSTTRRRKLYRVFVYDCPPLTKKLQNPATKKSVDFSKTREAQFRSQFHAELVKLRKTALRKGRLSDLGGWTIRSECVKDLLNGKRKLEDLQEADVFYESRQKGVDMKIGLDIASLAFKKQVDQIILIAGDADFVPAAKLARREGIDFVLDPMWASISEDLNEHIDGLKTTCPRPVQKQNELQ
jgi:uncharacterized LabA/DUF88 family protein